MPTTFLVGFMVYKDHSVTVKNGLEVAVCTFKIWDDGVLNQGNGSEDLKKHNELKILRMKNSVYI